MHITLDDFRNMGFALSFGDKLRHPTLGKFIFQQNSQSAVLNHSPKELTIAELAWRPLEDFDHNRFTSGTVLIEMAPCQMWRPVLSDLEDKADKDAEYLIRDCINNTHRKLLSRFPEIAFIPPATRCEIGLALIEELKNVGLMNKDV